MQRNKFYWKLFSLPTPASLFPKEVLYRSYYDNLCTCSPITLYESFQSILQNATIWLHDTGILNRLQHDILFSLIHIPQPKMRHKEPLTIYQLGITMILLLVGIIISILVFTFELTTKRTEDCIKLTVTDASGKRLVSEWIYTNHPYNWRCNTSHFWKDQTHFVHV